MATSPAEALSTGAEALGAGALAEGEGLAEKQLIEEAGRLEVPGRPILYRTTGRFLQAFALESLDDLPALPALTENEQLEFDTDPAPPDPSPLLRPEKE